MIQRSATAGVSDRWSEVVPCGRGWVVRCGATGLCTLTACIAEESLAVRRAAEWIALALDPSRPTTLVGLPLVSDEQLEAMRFERAAMELEAVR